MKLFWVSHFVPFPPQGGAHQRSYNLLRHISKWYEVSLLAFNLQGAPASRTAEYAAELRAFCPRVQIWEPPYPWKSPRWWGQLAASPLFDLPFTCRYFWSPRQAASWAQLLEEHRGALLHFDSLDLAMFLPQARSFRKVLQHHNCESAMAVRRSEQEPNPVKKMYLRSEAKKLARVEGQICPLVDVNVVVSTVDAQLLAANSSEAHIHLVENGVDTAYFTPRANPIEPKTLVFAGALDWYPNISGLSFFRHDVWPTLKRECPEVRLFLVGRNPPASLARWAQLDNQVVVVANPDDVRPWVQRASVFVCPILDGGGSRLKILDALAMGMPVVSTEIGCEGLRVQDGRDICVANTPAAFAQSVMRLLTDDELRGRLGRAGRHLVEDSYGWERIALQLRQAYQCALDRSQCTMLPALEARP